MNCYPPPISILNNFLSPGGFTAPSLAHSPLSLWIQAFVYTKLGCGSLDRSSCLGPSFYFISAVNGRFLRFFLWPMSPDHVTFECVLSNKLLLQSGPDKEEAPAAPRATPPLHILYGLPPPLLQLPGASRDSGSMHVSWNATYMCLACRGGAGRRWLQGKSLVV